MRARLQRPLPVTVARGDETMQPVLRRLALFALERFPPLAYGPLVAAFVLCGWSAAALAVSARPDFSPRLLAVGLLALLIFFRLRLVDELKDAPRDRLARPERPLPRGLVREHELLALTAGVLVGEVGLALALGGAVVAVHGSLLLWSVLAAVDFGAAAWLRGRTLLAALVHSPIVPLTMACVWAAAPAASGGLPLVGALLLAWGVGLALEVGRKTLLPASERPQVETYSAAIGPGAATRLAGALLALGGLGNAMLDVATGRWPLVPAGLALGAVVGGLVVAHRRRYDLVARLVPVTILLLLLWPVTASLVLR